MKSKQRQKLKRKNQFRKISHILSVAFKYTFIIVILSGILLGSYYILVKYEPFKVKETRVLGTKSFVNERDVAAVVSGRTKDRQIFEVDTKALSQDLQDNFQGAKNIQVQRSLPNKLTVVVSERVPLAIIQSKEDYYIVDEDGYVLGLVQPEYTNLPKIRYEGDVKVGFFIDKQLVPLYLDLIEGLDKEGINVSSISIRKHDALVYVKDGVGVLVAKNKDIMESVEILGKLLEQLSAQGKNPATIDLRYDKVVVSYE